jgi:acyl dehydratase
MVEASLLTEEVRAMIGRTGEPAEARVTRRAVARAMETFYGRRGDLPAEGEPVTGLVLAALETEAEGFFMPGLLPDDLLVSNEMEFARPLRMGERLTARTKLSDIVERFGGRFGYSLHVRTEVEFVDAGGAVVARSVRTLMQYDASARGEDRAPEERGAGGPAEAAPAPPPAPVGAFEEGGEMPPLTVKPDLGQVIRFCALGWLFPALFYDAEAARAQGMPGTILPGPLKLGLLYQALDGWVAGKGFVRHVRAAHRRPDLTGQPITITGRVARVYEEGGERRADLEMAVVNAQGATSVRGFGTVVLMAQ